MYIVLLWFFKRKNSVATCASVRCDVCKWILVYLHMCHRSGRLCAVYTHVGYHMSLRMFSSVQSLSHVWLYVTPWTAARQASLSITNSWSLLKLMSVESVMPSNHLILCRTLFLPSIFPSIRSFQMSQLFVSGGQSIGVQLQHQSFQWIFRTDFL